MNHLFQISFITVFSLLVIIRICFKIKARLYINVYSKAEGITQIVIRSLIGLFHYTAVFLYIIFPQFFPWMYVVLPLWLRFAGIGLASGSLILLFLAHASLGTSFSATINIKKDHRLVTTGPYKYMRHPMYVAYFTLFISAFFISGSWAIGLSGICIISILMTFRLKKEEELLIKKFKRRYLDYADSTHRFFPWPRKTRE
jgi:protein-S-isoprenylcysteine O-methyltransferase Ste14